MKIYISQRSVATQLGCGRICNNHGIANGLQCVPVDENKNRLIFGEDVDGQTFFGLTV